MSTGLPRWGEGGAHIYLFDPYLTLLESFIICPLFHLIQPPRACGWSRRRDVSVVVQLIRSS